jgi:hypothetical protein
MNHEGQNNRFSRKASFFNTIFIPFLLISIFAEFYSYSFMMSFLVDNSPAVKIARSTGLSQSEEIDKAMVHINLKSGKTNEITLTDKGPRVEMEIRGSLFAAGFRLVSIIVLYLWLRPFFGYIRKRDEALKNAAEKRYNNFYTGIFCYFLVIHLIWGVSSLYYDATFSQIVESAGLHFFWFLIECYLFYIYLEPSLFMYISGIFAEKGASRLGRSSLSIYMKLSGMLVFLVLIPLAVLAMCIYKDYFCLLPIRPME